MKAKFIQTLLSHYPDLKATQLEQIISENLISPFTISLSAKILDQAQLIANTLFALRQHPEYKKYLKNHYATDICDPGNRSLMMSYDFHVDEHENLKLIEVNTNAAFLILGWHMYESFQLPPPIEGFTLEQLKHSFLKEHLLCQNKSSIQSLCIVDEKPQEQRLFVEFLVYQQLFQKWGWRAEIFDTNELAFDGQSLAGRGHKLDFVYNRDTDFYFEEARTQSMLNAWKNRTTTVSPNPHEYFLMADKRRLIDWSILLQAKPEQTEFALGKIIEPIKSHLPKTQALTKENAESLWAERKKYFFKPMTAFGSKQSYRGASISRNHFEGLIDQNFVAQEFVRPTEQIFMAEGKEQSLKYDLRVYFYEDQLQLVVARLYQGQVTNLRTPYGGFACVQIAQ